MRILIANDDGIYSPGIATLAEVATRIRRGAHRGSGRQSNLPPGMPSPALRPLSYKRTPIENFEAYRVNGTPADCVALGAYHWEKVDVVLSGHQSGQ